MKKSSVSIVTGGVIAALYVVLTFMSAFAGMSSGVIQLRLSECLYVLAMYSPYSVGGLFVGCFIANLLTGAAAPDIIFGAVATLIGAYGTYRLRKQNTMIALIPPIVANTLIIPFVLKVTYHVGDAMWFIMVTVGIGELLSCGLLGILLKRLLDKNDIIGSYLR